MRSGWLAFVVSVALHGAVLGAFCLLPGGRVERSDASFVPEGSDTDLAVPTFFCERSAVFDVLSTPPVRAEVRPEPIPVKKTKPAAAVPAAVAPTLVKPANPNDNGSAASAGPKSGSEALPGGAATTFFSVAAKGQTIVYLIDASASMGLDGAFAPALAELLRSVRRLPETARFQVIVFNGLVTPLPAHLPGWLHANPQVVATVEQALRKVRAEGKTDPASALRYALSRHPAVLFFLTDAGEFQLETAHAITRFNGGHSIIHVIELGTGQAGGNNLALRTLANGNRGTFKMVSLVEQQLSYESP
jgi:hypothetical protein